ncbi:helix-turn-helix domain-containing protein [Geminisphaera colitermitum]|uniref:helix-turn-helix domain-containing protein n=1 Tax=Geminisphaera colitermitum TaxID=1148786 RepID=UPI0009DD2B45|nr:helix-turn-helix domain-containing protein [Geminisphaera colitermitum]
MNLMPFIASRLRELRSIHGLTQQEVSELSGFHFTFYQQLESGRKKQIWLETIERLAAPYGLEVWQFLKPGPVPPSRIKQRVISSNIHYRKRKGPYNRARPVSVSPPTQSDEGREGDQ